MMIYPVDVKCPLCGTINQVVHDEDFPDEQEHHVECKGCHFMLVPITKLTATWCGMRNVKEIFKEERKRQNERKEKS